MCTRAEKTDSKLRLALAGPPGSGNTYIALTLPHALAEGQGVALIDTEHGSASVLKQLVTAGTTCKSAKGVSMLAEWGAVLAHQQKRRA